MKYFFLDRIIEMELGKRARALKNITFSEDIFTDHFPGFPIFPGALMIEAMAQLSGVLIDTTIREREKRNVLSLLTIVKSMKFRGIVIPGDQLILTSDIEGISQDSTMVNVKAEVNDQIRATGKLFFTYIDIKEYLNVDKIAGLEEVKDILFKMNKLGINQWKQDL